MEHPEYKYKRIDLATDAIRLIRLQAGLYDTPIKCELFESYLDREKGIPYQALSYTWGDLSAEKVPINIIGRTSEQEATSILQVTKNLYEALQHLRDQHEDRVLWVDAICIDQSESYDSLQERNHQVQQMRLVYEMAESVVVWLGGLGPDPNSMEMLGRFAKHLDSGLALRAFVSRRAEPLYRELLQHHGHQERLQVFSAMNDILDRPWWRRIWIIQEVASAQAGQVIVGEAGKTISVPMRTFAILPGLMELASSHPHIEALLDVMPSVGQKRRGWWLNRERSLKTLILKFRQSEASDPRDLIYALLGIATDDSIQQYILPDYNIKEEELFRKTILYLQFKKVDNIKVFSPVRDRKTLLKAMDEIPGYGFEMSWDKVLSRLILESQEAERDKDIIWILTTQKVDTNWVGSYLQRTLFFLAVENGYTDIIKLLLERGKVEVDLKDIEFGETPLSRAAGHGYTDIVKLLLETGKAEIDFKDIEFGKTPLYRAVENRHTDIVKLLLETGKVEVDLKDKFGRTPLYWAVESKHADIVKLLLETGKVEVDLKDKFGRTPLYWAVESKHADIVKLLLETGKVEVDLKDKFGDTPFYRAVESGQTDIVKLLLETGKVEVELKDNLGEIQLSRAVESGYTDVVKLLLETGKVDVNLKDKFGQTPLLRAVQRGYTDIVKLLLETGKVNIDFKDEFGQTLLSRAVANGYTDIIKMLQEADSKVGLEDEFK